MPDSSPSTPSTPESDQGTPPLPPLPPDSPPPQPRVVTPQSSTPVGMPPPTQNDDDGLAVVPVFILASLNEREKCRITQKMQDKGHSDNTAWPSRTFAEVYLPFGKNIMVRRFAQLILTPAEIGAALLQAYRA